MNSRHKKLYKGEGRSNVKKGAKRPRESLMVLGQCILLYL